MPMTFNNRTLTTPEEIFDEAFKIAKTRDQYEADSFLNRYATWLSEKKNIDRAEALEKAKMNIGFIAGDRGTDARILVNHMYGAVHPIFGNHYEDLTVELVQELVQNYQAITKKKASE